MDIKISVIVPAYNSEKYIENCVDTVAKQTFKGFEMLVINDGSIDNTGEILKNEQKKYNWLRVINTENRGTGSCKKYRD